MKPHRCAYWTIGCPHSAVTTRIYWGVRWWLCDEHAALIGEDPPTVDDGGRT